MDNDNVAAFYAALAQGSLRVVKICEQIVSGCDKEIGSDDRQVRALPPLYSDICCDDL